MKTTKYSLTIFTKLSFAIDQLFENPWALLIFPALKIKKLVLVIKIL